MLAEAIPVGFALLLELAVLIFAEHLPEFRLAGIFDIPGHLAVLFPVLSNGFALLFVFPGVVGVDFEYLSVLIIAELEHFPLALGDFLGALLRGQSGAILITRPRLGRQGAHE